MSPLALSPFSGGERAQERHEPANKAPGEPPPPPERLAPARTLATGLRPGEPPRPRVEVPSPSRARPAATEGSNGSVPQRAETARVEIVVRRAETGHVVPGAVLELGLFSPGGDEDVSVHRTDASGALRIDLPPGSLRVVAWDRACSGGPLHRDLLAGTRTELGLELGSAHRVAGRVTDATTGEPVAGAAVAFWTFAERDVVLTAADGTFTHPRFPQGGRSHQIRVTAPGHGAAVRYLEIASDGTWRLPANLASGADVRGTGDPWLELSLPPPLEINGRVLDGLGRPVSGAVVTAEGFFRVLPTVASRDGAEGCTDAQGRFGLRGLRADVGHTVYVRAPGFAEHEVDVQPNAGGELGDVTLSSEAVLSGVVVDPDGLPVEGALVVLRRPGETASTRDGDDSLDVAVRVRGAESRTRTAPEGTFLFEGLVPTTYRVEVLRDGEALVSQDLEALPECSSDSHGSPVLHLPGDTLTLTGIAVVDGRPAPGAVVEIHRRGPVGRVTADSEGRFRAAGLDDTAPYELSATWHGPDEGDPPATAGLVSWAFERPVLELRARGSEGPALARGDR